MTVELLENDVNLEELPDDIEFTYRSMERSKARLLKNIADFDRYELAQECGSTGTAAWLIRRLKIAHSTAHEYVHVARQLDNFEYLQAVFAEGDLSYSTVRLLLKYLTLDNEAELVDKAKGLGYHGLEVALAGKDKPNEEPQDKEYYLRVKQENNGDLRFWGRLNSIDGQAFLAGLKIGHLSFAAAEEELGSLVGDDGLIDESSLNEMMKEKENEEEARQAHREASGYGMPTGRAMIYALMGMVQMVRTTPTSTLRAPGAHVNVVMTVDGRAYLPNNAGASTKGLENVVANALLRLDTVDSKGLVLNMGRATRLATPAQVNALLLMWGGQCAMPGCTHRRFIEIHHIRDWAEGGRTDLENLIPLCSGCHSLVTEGAVEIGPDGDAIVFAFRDGSRYVSRNYSLPVRDDAAWIPQAPEDRWDLDHFAG